MDLRTAFRRLERPDLESLSRANTKSTFMGEYTALVRVLDSYLLYVDTRDLSIAPHLCMDGYWEMWVAQALSTRFREGWRVADIGANYGYYSLFMAKLGAKEVVAFEPHPLTARLLNNSVRVNGANVVVRQVAVSDVVGTATLFSSPKSLGGASLIAEPATHTESFEVMSIGLSEEVNGVFDFIKIDVEHQEDKVWRSIERADRAQVLLELDFKDAHARPLIAEIERTHVIERIDYDASFHSLVLGDDDDDDRGTEWLWLTPR